MWKQAKNTLITLLYIVIFLNCASIKAETISFDSVLQQGIDNSFDLKIADVDIGISEAELKEAKSEYYPTLQIGYNNEYSRNLDKRDSQVASVGSTFLNDTTRFQNLIYAGVSYNMFDFGARGKRKLIAQKDVLQKEYYYSQVLRDLKIDLLELYTDALISFKESRYQKSILDIYKDLFEAKERLYEAGINNKLSVMEEAVNIARSTDKIDKARHRLSNALNELSFYTYDEYDAESLDLKDLIETHEAESDLEVDYSKTNKDIDKNISVLPEFDAQNLIESKIYQAEIEKKEAELKLIKRERLPKFEFYTNYQFYGSDENNPISSLTDLRSKNLAVGLSASMPIFDGFNNSAQQDKAKLEIERLKLEKEKKLHEIKKQHELYQHDSISYKKEFENQLNLLKEYKKQLNAIERMTENKLMEKTYLLTKKAELINQILNTETSLINTFSSIKKLEYLSEGSK